MKAIKLYSGISAIYTSSVLVLLFMTDILYISDKSNFSVVISMFGTMEALKYFILTSHFPDIVKTLGTSNVSYSYSAQRTSSDKKSKQIFKGITLITLMTMLYHIAIILLGAGVIENFEETFLLSALLCVLTFLPLCVYFGPNSAFGVLFNVYPTHINNFEATLRQTVFVTLFGAWLGAFVIPLDWDRPWQKWPIPCAVGAMCGYGISHIIKVPYPNVTRYSV